MKLQDLQKNWKSLGEEDPMWAILTHEEKKGNNWNEDDFFKTGETTISKLMEKLDNQFGKSNFEVGLDFGCGIGRLTRALCKFCSNVYGVDIADTMIDKANEINAYPDKCEYILNEENNLALFEANKFDFILTLLTLQHMKPAFAVDYLKEFFRVLKPGGVLIFQLPHKPTLNVQLFKFIFPDFLINFYRKVKYANQGIMEMYWTTEKDIVNLAKSNGMKMLKVETAIDEAGWTHKQYILEK